MRQKLLNISIDYIRLYQALEIVEKWLKSRGKHYIVTPNPEMLVDAGFDDNFRKALNGADLSIPDSLRLGWGSYMKGIKNPFLRLIYSPGFLFPHVLPRFSYPKTTGVDLMEALLRLSLEKGFTTAYLGGSKKVADKLFKCLKLKYPGLKIAFCSGNMVVNSEGEIQFDPQNNKTSQSKYISRDSESSAASRTEVKTLSNFLRNENMHAITQKIDIMFVAFGHKKQERWMEKNLPKLNTRVMVGVGGAFDYLSGSVPRAPLIMQKVGMEWVFRIMVQPWRIKRFWKLFYFVYLILFRKS